MNAAIVSVGNELLGGYVLDSNSTWIGRKLMDLGVRTTVKMAVRDSRRDIVEALEAVSVKADLIFCTGGLGPTSDDVTKEAVCDFMGVELRFEEGYYEKLQEKFRKRGVEFPESNRDQAFVPDGGEIIPNPNGSALGIEFRKDDRRFFVLPGVPSEMKKMMEESVLPALQTTVTESFAVRTVRTTGIMESALYDLVAPVLNGSDVDVAFLPGFTGVDVRLTHESPHLVDETVSLIYETAGDYVYGEEWETVEEMVGNSLREQGITVSVAESCTGGLLMDRLTNVPGSSDYFSGGIVTYSNEAKTSLLGVKAETLESHGAVSGETAGEMARGVRGRFDVHMGVSITGIAGPGGATEEKPLGLTYIGVDLSGSTTIKRFVFSDDRRFNKELAAQAALNIMRLELQ